ncbi:MAG: hypothetical protein R3Y35_07165 [Clostridia bacterium]
MKIEELITKHTLSDEIKADIEKLVQSAEDKIRTDYSKQVKELEKFKPIEKSNLEIELEQTKQQLKEYEFKSDLNKLGVKDDLAKYLKTDIDLDEFNEFYKTLAPKEKESYVPKNHSKDLGITKEQFKNMNITDRTKLYNENKDLYNQLKN